MLEKKINIHEFGVPKEYGTLGDYLKQSRLSKNITIDYVYENIRIQKKYIEALENNDYKALPERTYSLGYLRLYANLLDLPHVDKILILLDSLYAFSNPMASQFDDLNSPMAKNNKDLLNDKSVNMQNVKNYNFKIEDYKKYYIYGVVVFLLALILVTYFLLKSNESTDTYDEQEITTSPVANEDSTKGNNLDVSNFNSVDKTTVDSLLQQGEDSDNAQEVKEAQPAEEDLQPKESIKIEKLPKETIKHDIILVAKGEVWVRIFNTENPSIVYVDQIFKANEEYVVPGVPGISMSVGNYKVLDVKIDGKVYNLKTSKKYSVVLNGIDLNRDNLLNLYGNKE